MTGLTGLDEGWRREDDCLSCWRWRWSLITGLQACVTHRQDVCTTSGEYVFLYLVCSLLLRTGGVRCDRVVGNLVSRVGLGHEGACFFSMRLLVRKVFRECSRVPEQCSSPPEQCSGVFYARARLLFRVARGTNFISSPSSAAFVLRVRGVDD